MLKLQFTNQFKKDFKLVKKRGISIQKFENTVELLSKGKPLPLRFRDHQLTNSKEYKNVRECHIEPDCLLIYKILNETFVLQLIRIGTHSDLF